MKYGYITNGFRDHTLDDIFAILKEAGYAGVGLSLDFGHLDPFASSADDVLAVRDLLRDHGLEVVVETGARFMLDAKRKHYPTLISFERRKERIGFLLKCLEIAQALEARALSFWSGAEDKRVPREKTWSYLVEGLEALSGAAAGGTVRLAFEPEPGMFIDDMKHFRELLDRYPGDDLGLTLDLGHLQCTEKPPLDQYVREFASVLRNVHVDDIRAREHEHLALGEGDIDFHPLIGALSAMDYDGLCSVELPRHSHQAPEQAKESIRFLRQVQMKA